ncbi:MAG: hypothetical protein JNG89_09930 [Planctomycetaceae bacterium]|nr:hypothetical protein [Planctomycetaceae bacterium]
MQTDPESPQVLARLRTEADAQFLIDHLGSVGIRAMMTGNVLLNVYPEVPADVRVLVRACDLERAQVVRADLATIEPRVR